MAFMQMTQSMTSTWISGGCGSMATIRIERVPKPSRRPDAQWQVTVDGSAISRHRTKAQARDRARQARGGPSNTAKNIAERAIETAKIGAPVDASLQTMGGEENVANLARGQPSNTYEGDNNDGNEWTGMMQLAFETDQPGPDRDYTETRDPDWHNNPDNLDSPEEVREDLREDGLDPMDTRTQDQAMFGHFLVHALADDDDRGGRSPEQLEAEHDMVVAAMNEHGADHRSPLDHDDIEGGDKWADPFGVGLGFGGEK